MDFIYTKVVPSEIQTLSQGDILVRSEKLRDAIQLSHSYYADASDYSHFIVLTQSCDLVRRNSEFSAPYITIAAVRPLAGIVDRFIASKARTDPKTNKRIVNRSIENKIKQLLERLLHNTEENYFFIPGGSQPNIDIDMCAYLHLSIALVRNIMPCCLSQKLRV